MSDKTLPVPVLANAAPMGQTPSCESEVVGGARESTTESQSSPKADLKGQANSRGGQSLPKPKRRLERNAEFSATNLTYEAVRITQVVNER